MNIQQIQELWIGDEVWIDSQNCNGKFEGFDVESGKAKIKLRHSTSWFPISEIGEARAMPKEEIIFPSPSKTKIAASLPFDPSSKEIDLHIERLNPDLQHERAEIILEYQIKNCRKFLEQSILQRRPHVTIIHGKGEGVLRLEVEHLLQSFDEVNFSIPTNNGGASEVWFQYY